MDTPNGFYKDVLDNLHDGVYVVDAQRRITYWNRGAERISGFLREEVLGHHCANNVLRHLDDSGMLLCHNACPLAETIRDGKAREVDIRLQHAAGHRIAVRVRASPVRDASGNIIGAVESFSDVSAMIAARQAVEARDAAQVDPLTGVANRRAGETHALAVIGEVHRLGISCGFLFIDIDDLATVNVLHSRAAGDKLLASVAGTLRDSIRSTDVVGRWSGDEFAVLLRRVNPEQLLFVANKLRTIVEKSRLNIGSHTVRATVSIGATLIRHGDTLESMSARANMLLQQAKIAGGNHTVSGA